MFQNPGSDKATMGLGRKSFDEESTTAGKIFGGKRSHCVILPANIPMFADSLERRGQNW